ncbi:MAG: response regulator transcription factor [Actinomycetota bacterium]|nr:response regulator transcription factor [Actinomycetota bacterium]
MRSPPARVLLIEDEAAIRDAVTTALSDAGYQVREKADGTLLRDVAGEFRPDLAILDIALPGPDGLTLARLLRTRGDLPILFLTARDSLGDRLAGFAAGADDYLVKPFALTELLARVHALLRRSGRLRSVTIEVGDLVLDESARAAWQAGKPLDLTPTELQLLAYLVARRGRAVSKAELLTQVWGYGSYDPNLVEVRISSLRRKIEADGPRIIHTVHGHGYTVRLPEPTPN